jgi:UDP-N-acetylglucosamine--N-acetylmuramyl-(pentapeptide) pyrophosphoryl-undecaprenol N-acetylglucosamine transferase
MSRPVLIMAGGTGGHVFPALVIADALRKLDRKVVWLGTGKGIENRLVPEAGLPLEKIRVSGLRRKGLLSWLTAPFKLLLAEWDALRVVSRCRPSVVLGMGGFAAGPGGLAAWLLRKPLVIHEQNAAAGLTNRLLAGLAREVLEAFPGSFSGRKATTVGNPVRDEILAIATPAQRFADRAGQPLRLLVLGGSQGALALNQLVPQALALLGAGELLDVRHQAGAATHRETARAYAEHNLKARVDSFIDDMAEAYAWADLVICRSGALTVSELAAAGVGAILVPYPGSVDDHQTLNAKYLADAGAAVLIQQADLTPARLEEELKHCIEDRGILLERANNARKLAPLGAADKVIAACLAVEQTA